MPFTQVQPQAPAVQATPQTTNLPQFGGVLPQFGGPSLQGTPFTGFGRMQDIGGMGGYQQPEAPQTPSLPQYTYTPAAIQPLPSQAGLQSLNAIMPGQDLYSNTQAPWYIPPQQPTTGQGLGGWDASSFMQGLRSLQPNLPGGK